MLQIVGSLTIVIDETYLTQNTKIDETYFSQNSNTKIKCPKPAISNGREKKDGKNFKEIKS